MNIKELPEEFICRQQEYIQAVAEFNREKTLYAFVDTYGCQQNEADSEIIRGILQEMGYMQTDDENIADVIVINSCAVREHAEQRVLGNVGQLVHSKRKTNCIIAVCGCMVQQPAMAEKIKKSYRHVDMVFGVHALPRFPELLYRALTEKKRIFDIEQSDGVIAEGLPVLRKDKTKAWISIMYGCNNFCTYCIVPYVRGRERSRDPEKIVAEVTKLVSEGCHDITLLGQNVNSYGNDLDCGVDFSSLLEMINAIPGDFRIRFMTSHPKDATPRLFDTMAKCEKVARHIHLPFQSGSDRILSLMNRRYDSKKYRELVAYAREKMPGISVTSDVIVGFPGETEEDFEKTMELVEDICFDGLFVFIYSKRSGTPAAEMEDVTPRSEKVKRFQRLFDLHDENTAKMSKTLLGTEAEVLVEGVCTDQGEYNLIARTDGNRPIYLKGSPDLVGTFLKAKIENSSKWGMFGKISDRG
ncbi:MAG: tRNA (N6-isopentenyl adenosine(37)-C2)-methylthiotransferase MiaB [Oscillospiraceae bacterium]|nr:tRNA (N6-isopentenyl adenosine(37)-C2)-methylthiotransferase MiaB [Oscillospiraceae bacterium]